MTIQLFIINNINNQSMSTGKLPLLGQGQPQFKQARNSTLQENYDPAAYPPDLEFAMHHGLSRRVGKYIAPLENVQRCRCCLEPIHKIDLPLCCNLSELFHCGTSTPLYFQFVKQILTLLVFNFFILALPFSILNITLGNECRITDGGVMGMLNWICRGSVINIMSVEKIDQMQIQAVIMFAAVLINIIFIGYLELQMELMVVKYGQGQLRAADYSLMIKGLPSDITITQIQKYVEDKMLYSGAPDLVINKIYIIYNFKNYLNMLQRKQDYVQKNIALWYQLQQNEQNNLLSKNYQKKLKLQKEKTKLEEQVLKNGSQLDLIQTEIIQFQEITNKIRQKIAMGEALQDQTTKSISNFSGKCIITMNNRRSQQKVLQKNLLTPLQRLSYNISDLLGGQKSKIIVAPAPQSDDIIFANMGSKRTIIWRNRILYTLLIFLLLGIDFLIVALAKKLIKQEKAIQEGNIIFSFINSIIVSLFCSLFRKIIRTSEQDSYYNTYSKLCYEIVSKMVVVFMINMLFTTFVANVASFYLLKQDQPTFDAFPLNFQSFLFDCFFLIATNPIFSTFLVYFDHRHFRQLFKQHRISTHSLPVSQGEANRSFQSMNLDICYKYGTMYRFLIFTAGITILYPLSIFICFIAILVLYWMDKYLLLRRYSITLKVTSRFTSMVQTIMAQFPIYLSLTTFLIMFIPIQDGTAFTEMGYSKAYYYIAGSALVVSLINYIVGNFWIKSILRNLLGIKGREQEQQAPQYKFIQNDLQTDYSHHYPYYRVSKTIGRDFPEEIRKSKVKQLRENEKLGTFDVIKHYMSETRYS